MSEVQQLVAALRLKDSFSGPLAKIRRNLKGFDTQLGATESRAFRAGQQIGTGIRRGAVLAAGAVGQLTTQVIAGLRSLADLETQTLQTNAVLKSTKGIAGQTSESIRNLAEKYENLNATIDDKVIQSAENVLLTFTAIREDAFEPALAAALDLSTALDQDLQTSIIQVGKALQDPIRGMTALRRAGVNFSADQQKVIKNLVETGQVAKAQQLILKELNTEFGGSFQAAGKGAEGTIAAIGDAVEDLQKALAQGLFPVIQRVLPKIRAALADPKVLATITKIGESIAGLFSDENIAEGGRVLSSLFETAKAAAPVMKEAALATLGVVKAAVSLFTSLPKEIQQLAIGAFAINKITGGLVTNLAGGLISSVLKQLVSGVVNVQGAVVNVGGVAGAGGVAAAGGASKVGRALSTVGKVFLVGAAVGVFAELKGILDEQSARNREQASGLTAQTQGFVKVAGIEDMKRALAGIEAQERHLEQTWEAEGFAFRLNIDGVRDAVNAQKAELKAAILTAEARSAAMQVHATERSEAIASQKADAIRRAAEAAALASRRVEAAENRSASTISSRLGARITGAQRAQVAASNRTSAEVRRKRLSVKNIIPVTINNRVSVQETIRTQTTFKKFGNLVTVS